MATYVCWSRTNYFRVRDLDAFKEDARSYGIEFGTWATRGAELVLDEDPDNKPDGAIALFAYTDWPTFDDEWVADRLNIDLEETPDAFDGLEHRSMEGLIAAHLVDTDIAIIKHISYEKMRYLGGYAVAVNARGEHQTVHLDDIYTLAQSLSITSEDTVITPAEF